MPAEAAAIYRAVAQEMAMRGRSVLLFEREALVAFASSTHLAHLLAERIFRDGIMVPAVGVPKSPHPALKERSRAVSEMFRAGRALGIIGRPQRQKLKNPN